MSALGRLRGRDFLDFDDLCAGEVTELLDLAARMKAGTWTQTPLSGRSVAILFQKPSVRTRVSFHVGVRKLGGEPITLQDFEVGLGTRETPEDVGHVLERYVDAIVARLSSHRDLLALAQASSKPVINALTDASHPCQVLGDLLTIREAVGRLDGSVRVAFVGDGNNVVSSLMQAATLVGFPLTVVSPPAYYPLAEARARARDVTVTADLAAIAGADVVYTDVWASMGQEQEAQERRRQFAEYQVNGELMALAPGAVFMHCLPAHRGEEVTDDVIESPRSIVFDQAENRLWAQMALLAAIFAGGDSPPTPLGMGPDEGEGHLP